MGKRKKAMVSGSLILALVIATFFTGVLVKPALAAEQFNVTLTSLPAGFAAYSISIALADMINKNSDWLRATAVEGRGPVVPLRKLIKDPKNRKDLLFSLPPGRFGREIIRSDPLEKFPLTLMSSGMCVLLDGL